MPLGHVAVSLRDGFKQNTFEDGGFQQETYRLLVIARPQGGRGNLKVEGVASRNEAREHETGSNDGRFFRKAYHLCVIARPQGGRGNLKVEGMEFRNEA